MWHPLTAFLFQCLGILKDALLVLVLPADIFVGLAVITKGLNPALAAAKQAIRETRVNLTIYVLDSLIVGPVLIILYALTTNLADAFSIRLINSHFWDSLPTIFVACVAVIVSDFVGYWRHRLEHTRFLWPSHSVHHSDTTMTWLALLRFHPINRLSTFIIDNSILILLGFPAYALLVYTFVKHYYGFFIHADLPWDYGRLGKVFVSPVMHRWHHSIEQAAYQTNFATIFSIFDRVFGTYRVPRTPQTSLGVESHSGKGVAAQLLYPFKLSAYRLIPGTSRDDGLPHKLKDPVDFNRGADSSLSI
jgi:sterol desaturase/sphingolipid hydroxylase (fatty acid hydroxylase superfamily)